MDSDIPFGTWLKQHRRAHDLSRENLAGQIGCSISLLEKLETGERRPSRQVATRLAHILKISVDDQQSFIAYARSTGALDAAESPLPQPTLSPLVQMIGREIDCATLRQLIIDDSIRLITLCGPPGVGKTRLGIQVADDLRRYFIHGSTYVSLAPVFEPALVISTIAQALNLLSIDATTLDDQVFAALERRHMLLVLDNFEHVLDAASLVANLHAHCLRLTILVTSRAPLHLSCEYVYIVGPLAMPRLTTQQIPAEINIGPLPVSWWNVDAAATYPAVALFAQRARAARSDFALTQANIMDVIHVCHSLDGLPLAIELAAARSRVFTPHMLLEQLHHRLDMLTLGPRDAPNRHQTLRLALAWSYDLLTAPEQALFRRLGIFVGGWRLEAAIAVCVDEAPPATTDRLEALVNQSLVQTSEDSGGQTRFSLLETVRDYALEQLNANGEIAQVQCLIAHHYLKLVELAAHELPWGPKQAFWLAYIAREIHNLRAILAWSLETSEQDERELNRNALGLQINGGLWGYWLWRGPLFEGCNWFERLIATGEHAPLPARAKALLGAAYLEHFRSMADAVHYGEESMRLYQAIGDRRGIAQSQHAMGRALRMQGEHFRAEAISQAALALFRELDDIQELIWVLISLGDCARDQRDFQRAERYFHEALSTGKRVGNVIGVAYALDNLGRIAHTLGDEQRAFVLLSESLTAIQTLDAPTAEADLLSRLAYIAYMCGDLQQAAQQFRESLLYWWQAGTRIHLPPCIEGLAVIAAAQGRVMHSARLFGAAALLRETIPLPIAQDQQNDYERDLALCRSALNPEAFATAWSQGYSMPLEQAIIDATESR